MIYVYDSVSEKVPKESSKQDAWAFHSIDEKNAITEQLLLDNGFVKSEGPGWQYRYKNETEEVLVDIKNGGDIMHKMGSCICWTRHEFSVSKLQSFLEKRGSKLKIKTPHE